MRLLCLLSLMATCFVLGDVVSTNTVSVTSTGSIQIPTKTARIRLGVVLTGTVDQNASDLQRDSSQIATRIYDVLKGNPVIMQLHTSVLSILPRNEWQAQRQQTVFVGYTSSNMVEFVVNDTASVGFVLSAASTAGANTIESVQWEASAVEMASAKIKAMTLAAHDGHNQVSLLLFFFDFFPF